ncbi:MAG: head-tail adaptor protein [Marinibacterium sp.]|nr:head-tail adaptor protein [Marinibacterium sp.]
MTPPDLNRKLALEHAVRVPDGAGGYAMAWETLGTLWGGMRAASGRERGDSSGPVSVGRYTVTVRAAPVGAVSRPVAGQRFRDGVRVFAIRAVSEAEGTGLYLNCRVEEEVAS